MNRYNLFYLFKSDYLRYEEKFNFIDFLIKVTLGIGPLQSVFLYRLARWCLLKKIPIIHSILTRINIVLNSCEISAYADIGPGLKIAHAQGIVIGRSVKIGHSATIFHNITIGAKTPFDGNEEMPILNDNVTLYTGAKVLGAITVGSNVKIGADTLVIEDIPSNTTVVTNKKVKLIRSIE
jgi:serine O-acetyltransferase